jgi:hypothetical protein
MRLRFRGGDYEQFATPEDADEDEPLTENTSEHLRHAVERGGDEARSIRGTVVGIIALSVTVLLAFRSQLLPLTPEYELFLLIFGSELFFAFFTASGAIESSQTWTSELTAALYHVEMGDSEFPSRSEFADYPVQFFTKCSVRHIRSRQQCLRLFY